MAKTNDLKFKDPMVEDYGANVEEAFLKGMQASKEHYRVKLWMYKQLNDALDKKHEEELQVSRIQGKLDIIHQLFNNYALCEEKQKLESELVLAEAKVADVKVPYLDWYKLGEPQMFK